VVRFWNLQSHRGNPATIGSSGRPGILVASQAHDSAGGSQHPMLIEFGYQLKLIDDAHSSNLAVS
jgi:hypothetical protein